MAKASPIQPSFSAGEFSPRLYGRVDSERYKTGLETCLNYIPTTQGPLIPRPGFKYVGNNVKDPSKPPALLPFQFSQTQNYIIEAGQGYMRFYTNNGQILTSGTSYQVAGWGYQDRKPPYLLTGRATYPFNAVRGSKNPYSGEFIGTGSTSFSGTTTLIASGSVLELLTPYVGSSYLEIKYAQKQDTLYLFHKDYITKKLVRRGATDWTLQDVRFQDGPYLPNKTYSITGDSLRINFVPAGIIGSSVFLLNTAPNYRVADMTAGTNNAIRVHFVNSTAHSFLDGDRVWVEMAVGTTEANNVNSSSFASWPVAVVSDYQIELLGSTFANAYIGSGIVFPALFTQDLGATPIMFSANGIRYWGTALPNAANNKSNSISLDVDPTSPGLANSSNVIYNIWRLGAFNTLNGYPSTGCFHQQRLAVSGSPGNPQRIDLSVSGESENFAPTGSSFQVLDSNAISFNLDHVELNKVNWIKSDDKGLLAGTFSSEFQITPSNQAAALTPTNVNAAETSAFGSYDSDALKAGNATIYIQRAQKAIRELNYFFQVDTYRSTDITELSEHITEPAIFKIVSQKEVIPIVWTLRTDGVLLSMCYSRDDTALQVGWSRHQLGGQSDSAGSVPEVKSMAVIPDPTGLFDQLWITAKRYINGTSVVSVEYLTKSLEADTLQEDFYYGDMGATYDSPVNITGITIAGSAILSATAHGFSNDDYVLINNVVGLNSSVVDSNGVIHSSNLVNYHQFVVGSTSANAFFLKDFNGNYIDSRGYSAYFSGGQVRKMVQTISGLNWLKNETVSVLADGKIHPNTIVNSGGILTLQYRAAKVQIGLPYNMDGKTLRPEAGAQDGTSIGKKRRTARVAFMLNKATGIYAGPDFDRLTPIELPGPAPEADKAQPLFSGLVRESIEGEFNFEGQVAFRQSSPTAGMIQTITKFIEENDV